MRRTSILTWVKILAQGQFTCPEQICFGSPRKPGFRGKKGLVRSEGKEYVMKDGDIVLFRFNV